MQSNFAEASRCLERTFLHLQGSDEVSQRSRFALGLLMDALLTAEYTSERLAATILPFPHRRSIKTITDCRPD
jgi:hypothetical protein